MTPFYADDWLTVYQGDCRAVMAEMPAESVHCVVTSPPYWGLRDYGTATWDGGDADCDHESAKIKGRADYGFGDASQVQTSNVSAGYTRYRSTCACGAIRQDQQLGLERTPEEYVANMVAVFREVRRVLRKDGTVWLNLGDSYGGPAGNNRGDGAGGGKERGETLFGGLGHAKDGTRSKDLVGIPWRVAFALQADGWYLRSDIIWSKPNPMPESVTDRPTKAHEYLFLLSKSPTYFYDNEAVRQPISPYNNGQISVAPHGNHVLAEGHRKNELRQYDEIKGANIRSVWTIATQPYPGAHFATFPEELPERCIKAGTSERGVCPECGSPWVREIDVAGVSPRETLKRAGPMDKSAVLAGRDGSLGSRQGIQHAGPAYTPAPARWPTTWRR